MAGQSNGFEMRELENGFAPPRKPTPFEVNQPRPLHPGEFIQNEDGSHSTERTITVDHDGGFINIPTIYMIDGSPQEVDERTAVIIARDLMSRGHKFELFEDVNSAVASAIARSNAGGVFSDDAI